MIDQENFVEAIRSGDQAQVNALLETAPWLINSHDATGASALLVAVYNGQPEIVEELLARDYELDIWEAAATGQVARAAKLVTANPELANAYAPDGFTPLGLAAFFGNLEVLALMLQSGAEVNYPSKNPMQVRPLHSAVAHRDAETAMAMANLLLERGAEVNVAQRGGWTPLHQAAAHGYAPIVQLLLANGADVKAENEEGKTPLDMARENGQEEVIAILEEELEPDETEETDETDG